MIAPREFGQKDRRDDSSAGAELPFDKASKEATTSGGARVCTRKRRKKLFSLSLSCVVGRVGGRVPSLSPGLALEQSSGNEQIRARRSPLSAGVARTSTGPQARKRKPSNSGCLSLTGYSIRSISSRRVLIDEAVSDMSK